MSVEAPLSVSQHIVQIGLFLVAAIAVFGGSLQFYLGQPDTSPRLDNVHRFMAGVYLSTGFICLWPASLSVSKAFSSTCSRWAFCWQASGAWFPFRSSACPSQERSGWATSFPSWCCHSLSPERTTQAHESSVTTEKFDRRPAKESRVSVQLDLGPFCPACRSLPQVLSHARRESIA